ncbi:MAG: aminoglycoside phosphotransferase family protein [Xenococcaceae cyanobacterium]
MLSKTEIITQIEINFPQLKVWHLSKLGEGWDYRAYRINNKYVFRFPKSKQVSKNLEKEICLLPKIKSHINVAIPNFEFIGIDSEKQTRFVGYKEIVGSCLTKKLLNSLSTEIQERAIAQIAEFLNELHAIAPEEIVECHLETIDFKSDCEQDYQIVCRLILDRLTFKEQLLIKKIYRNYLDEPINFNYRPCLLHNDLSSDHILFDVKSDRVSGIIDFGDIAIGDPDYDLMYLLDDMGIDFIERFLKYYSHVNGDRLRRKLQFFQLADAVQLTIAGINDRDKSKKQEGLQAIKSLLKGIGNRE